MFEVNTISSDEFKRRTLELIRQRAEEVRVRLQLSKRRLGQQAEELAAAQAQFVQRIDVALATGNLTLH